MRYALLTVFLLGVLLVSLAGKRGKVHDNRPLRLFPDMDEQLMLRPQSGTNVFDNGVTMRRPKEGTIPMGYHDKDTEHYIGDLEFTGFAETGYYWSGKIGEFYGDGYPERLQLSADNSAGFVRRGAQRYDIHCAICHGAAGDGNGVASATAATGRVPAVAVLTDDRFVEMPNGQIFETITHGKGLMVSYGDKITVSDRWAIIAYLRVLQEQDNAESFLTAIQTELSSEQTEQDSE